jgi:hypothetical protein
MITPTRFRATSRVSRAIGCVKRIWGELDYAERRMLELRTGIPFTAATKRAEAIRLVDELEALYGSADAGGWAADRGCDRST